MTIIIVQISGFQPVTCNVWVQSLYLATDCVDGLWEVTVPFWFPTMQQHQRFLPVLPRTARPNATADSAKMKVLSGCLLSNVLSQTWTAGFLQAQSQQTLCLGQLKPVVHSPCHTQSDGTNPPPLIWIAAAQW